MALYSKTTWVNDVTPVNESNLNKIEEGIYQCSLNDVTSCELTYLSDTLTLKIKNTAGTELATYTATIPSGESVNGLRFVTTDNHCTLQYKTNASGGTWTDILDLSTLFYTKADINGCFEEVTVDPD